MAQNVWFYPLGVGAAFTAKHFFVNGPFHVDGREFFVDAPAYMGKMWAANNEVGEEQVDIGRHMALFITRAHTHARTHGEPVAPEHWLDAGR